MYLCVRALELRKRNDIANGLFAISLRLSFIRTKLIKLYINIYSDFYGLAATARSLALQKIYLFIYSFYLLFTFYKVHF